jgi:endonuclease/exonuclease/phosphatase family metal-dependent hydrolase
MQARRLVHALMIALASITPVAGCVQTVDGDPPSVMKSPPKHAATSHPSQTKAARDAGASRVAILTWNLNWFQDPTEGPSDDAKQYAAARDILADANADLIALEEIASEPAFDRLLADLPEYAGVLSGYDWTQKTALLWRATLFELASARAISGLDDAGRPPLEVSLRDKARAAPLLVVVIHAKAQADAASHDARERLAQGLKAHLDAEHATMPSIVLGDFNDRLSGSITQDAESPYRAFVDDARYATPTLRLDAASARESSYSWGATIDHIIVSDELAARVDEMSIDVRRQELLERYPDYTDTVSDHFPVTLALQ